MLSLFNRQVIKHFKEFPSPKVVVALSGGVDSMCLTHMLSQTGREVIAVTVDHKYRAGSRHEALQVGRMVGSYGVKHLIKELEYPCEIHSISNFEEVARHKRYEVLEKVCVEHQAPLFVAHNLDDQLETFLIRLGKNSSLYGLAGLRPVSRLPLGNSATVVYRPLLEVPKKRIVEYCEENGVNWFEDATNADPTLTERNWLRKNISNGNIHKGALLDLFQEAREMSRIVDEKSRVLEKVLATSVGSHPFAVKYPHNGSALLSFPPKLLHKDNQIVLARFMYRFLENMASIKHYHWAYAKIERGLVPKMAAMAVNGSTTVANLRVERISEKRASEIARANKPHQTHFSRNIRDPLVSFYVRRQEMLKEDVIRNTKTVHLDGWSEWIRFDRRFSVRVFAKGCVKIAPYCHEKDKLWVHEKLAPSGYMNGVPVVWKEGLIVSFPTYKMDVGVVSTVSEANCAINIPH